MNQPKDYKAIMLSSTFTDLKEHRQRAIEAISKLGYMPKVMEHSGAQAEANVIYTSLAMVRDAAAYIGVISLKYGQTPPDEKRNPNQLSVTELEFNEAMRLGRPIVLFIIGEEHPIKKADIESDPDKLKKLNEFRERAKRMRNDSEVHRIYEVFDSLEQFSTAAATAIGNLVRYLERSAPTEQREAGQIQPRTVSNIPINIPFHFVGRDDDFAAIDKRLTSEGGRAAITALHGLRGVGKTTLAAAYAERHRGDYRATWWIRAQTGRPCAPICWPRRAAQLGGGRREEEEARSTVMERLRHEGEGILLIYDNAVDADRAQALLPTAAWRACWSPRTRHAWRGVAAPVEIRLWPKEIGADYLIARTGRTAERAAALALSEALGGLPLAHEQAAAYCERLELPLAEYAKRFTASPRQIPRRMPATPRPSTTTASRWRRRSRSPSTKPRSSTPPPSR